MRDVQAAIISSSVSLCSPAHLLISGLTSCAAAGAAMARMPATIPGQMALRYGAGWVSHMVASVRRRPFKPRGGRSPMDRMIEPTISGKTGNSLRAQLSCGLRLTRAGIPGCTRMSACPNRDNSSATRQTTQRANSELMHCSKLRLHSIPSSAQTTSTTTTTCAHVRARDTQRALAVYAPPKDRLSQLSTKESDVRRETGQQPLEEPHDRKNFAFRRAASSSHPQGLAAQVAVIG